VKDDGLVRRLPFHVSAYAAFRAGYCSMFDLPAERERYIKRLHENQQQSYSR
jgi:hypothetical protein